MTRDNTDGPIKFDAGYIARTGYVAAIDAIEDALRGGFDPSTSLPRSAVDVAAGQLLLMPAAFEKYVAVKVVGVAPANPARGLPRISGTLLLLDAATLLPLAVMDGAAVTTLRTPAVSAAAARPLIGADGPFARMAVFGSGPQAAGHVRALHAVTRLGEVRVIARDADRADALCRVLTAELGVDTSVGDRAGLPGADIIVCATTAVGPLLDVNDVRRGALVIAVGSHQPGVLELPPRLLADAQVVVEDRETAMREAGEVVEAIEAGFIDGSALVPLRDVVTGAAAPDMSRTRIFKSMGMGWEDAVVAAAVWRGRVDSGVSVGE